MLALEYEVPSVTASKKVNATCVPVAFGFTETPKFVIVFLVEVFSKFTGPADEDPPNDVKVAGVPSVVPPE